MDRRDRTMNEDIFVALSNSILLLMETNADALLTSAKWKERLPDERLKSN